MTGASTIRTSNSRLPFTNKRPRVSLENRRKFRNKRLSKYQIDSSFFSSRLNNLRKLLRWANEYKSKHRSMQTLRDFKGFMFFILHKVFLDEKGLRVLPDDHLVRLTFDFLHKEGEPFFPAGEEGKVESQLFSEYFSNCHFFAIYTQEFLDALVSHLVGESGPFLEVAAGDGFLSQCLYQKGISIRATDPKEWKRSEDHDISYRCWDQLEELTAKEALADEQNSPRVVLAAWLPRSWNVAEVADEEKFHIGRDVLACPSVQVFYYIGHTNFESGLSGKIPLSEVSGWDVEVLINPSRFSFSPWEPWFPSSVYRFFRKTSQQMGF